MTKTNDKTITETNEEVKEETMEQTTFGAMVESFVPAVPAPTANDVHGIVWSDTMNTSQKIKALAAAGYKNASIQKILNPWYENKNGRALRYQHVRNVLTQTYKKA
jgi:hypothetical protein